MTPHQHGKRRPIVRLYNRDALDVYRYWPTPTTIISDGAYGVGGFPGDPRTIDGLKEWYEPHVAAWSRHVRPSTTLWFWNTEVGWATIHPLLVENGWEYVQAITWDKGISHIAGNINGDTIRQFPVVTEVCVFYRRRLELPSDDGRMKIGKEWLRHEWQRAGLTLSKANTACRVKNAATRKYLTQDWLWYWPPPEMMARLAAYANEYGRPAGRPYFSLNGESPVTSDEWATLRDRWTHLHGLTNVWTHPPVNGNERFRSGGKRSAPRVHNPGKQAAAHLNQKPLEFMRRVVTASTQCGDMLWEPFGGLCSAVVAAVELGRDAYAAEPVTDFFDIAVERIRALKVAVLKSSRASDGIDRKGARGTSGTRRQRDRRLEVAAAR